MCAVRTNFKADQLIREHIIAIRRLIKKQIPTGEGNIHKDEKKWDGFTNFMDKHCKVSTIGWWTPKVWKWAKRSLGTLGSGNHFAEIQVGDDGFVWLMLHSGSRNLGHKIASYYHNIAKRFNELWDTELPKDHEGKKITDLAYLPIKTPEAGQYIRDMKFALKFAEENRNRMMHIMKRSFTIVVGESEFDDPINIHHNYANLENHFGRNVWVHRKGATSAVEGQLGIIPGSQGTASYIVEGLGNLESFKSCSHGAGRILGRKEACRQLDVEEETKKMGDVVFDSWTMTNVKIDGEVKEVSDLEEASGAYKDIEKVMKAQEDLVKIKVRLLPLGVIKGDKSAIMR